MGTILPAWSRKLILTITQYILHFSDQSLVFECHYACRKQQCTHVDCVVPVIIVFHHICITLIPLRHYNNIVILENSILGIIVDAEHQVHLD